MTHVGKGFLIFFIVIMALFIVSYGVGKAGIFKGLQQTFAGQKIAVVPVKGFLADSEDILKEIEKYKDRLDVKAIVLRIDSPGGTVVAAQEVYSEIEKLREKKIILASLGNVAASGGYYIACAAKEVIANPGSITGSIGVISEFTNIQELMEKIGWKKNTLKSGHFKDIGNPMRDMTTEERARLQKLMDNIHQQFIRDVAKGRNMPVEEIIPLADGMIFTGEQAAELGLVDRLGSFQDTITRAAELAGIVGKPAVLYPEEERDTLLQYLMHSFFYEMKSLFIWMHEQMVLTSFHSYGSIIAGRR